MTNPTTHDHPLTIIDTGAMAGDYDSPNLTARVVALAGTEPEDAVVLAIIDPHEDGPAVGRPGDLLICYPAPEEQVAAWRERYGEVIAYRERQAAQAVEFERAMYGDGYEGDDALDDDDCDDEGQHRDD
jgi:hypothetical protein